MTVFPIKEVTRLPTPIQHKENHWGRQPVNWTTAVLHMALLLPLLPPAMTLPFSPSVQSVKLTSQHLMGLMASASSNSYLPDCSMWAWAVLHHIWWCAVQLHEELHCINANYRNTEYMQWLDLELTGVRAWAFTSTPHRTRQPIWNLNTSRWANHFLESWVPQSCAAKC